MMQFARFAYLHLRFDPVGGGVHNILRLWVCAANMGGFLSRNSLNKGPFFGRFSIWVGYQEISEK